MRVILLRNSYKKGQQIGFLLFDFNGFCPMLIKFTPHLNNQTMQERKIGSEGLVY